jgi:hypothetical protein
MDSPPTTTVTSDAFTEGQSIPARYPCDGASVPPGAGMLRRPRVRRALALVVDDPDARAARSPTGSWWTSRLTSLASPRTPCPVVTWTSRTRPGSRRTPGGRGPRRHHKGATIWGWTTCSLAEEGSDVLVDHGQEGTECDSRTVCDVAGNHEHEV